MADYADDRGPRAGFPQALGLSGSDNSVLPDTETIVAIATGTGKGGIGIVRVSGGNLSSLLTGILGKIPEPRRAIHAWFLNSDGEPIDEGVAIYYIGPASFTGEDVLELQGHGGRVVLQMILNRCVELGARPALPGEFTQRAFLNDKLDLAQAEAVADLIDSASEISARCAMRSLRGDFSRTIQSLVAKLIDIRMLVEATLDFPEEEIEVDDKNQFFAQLADLRDALAHALDRGRRGSVLRHGLSVVIAGRPNMGKSSLLNRLAGEDLAIVTAVPGTTRDAIRQTINIDGVPLNIVDTAGLRDTADEVERIGIARTWDVIEGADIALLIVEAGTGIQAEDEAILSRLPAGLPRMVVHNKIDLICAEPLKKVESGAEVIHLSAITGAGLSLLRASLLEKAGWIPGEEDVFMARARHLEALQRGSSYLEKASTVISRPELFAEELRLAQLELNAITGEFVADDLLGEIFSRFCIGK
jgi:tRNA modification GTPase